MAEEKKSQDEILYVRGAHGFYHSVPAGRLEEFQRQQQQLEKSGKLMEALRIANEKASKLVKK